MYKKRGQAAMEFLMTYGWAILAAIIAIGVLAFLGFGNVGVTGNAVVNPPFYANAWNVQADHPAYTPNSGITLELRNNGGETFNIQSVDISNCGTYSTVTPIVSGNSTTINVDCGAGGLTEGENFRGDVTIIYNKAGSTVDLTSTGTIAEEVTA